MVTTGEAGEAGAGAGEAGEAGKGAAVVVTGTALHPSPQRGSPEVAEVTGEVGEVEEAGVAAAATVPQRVFDGLGLWLVLGLGL